MRGKGGWGMGKELKRAHISQIMVLGKGRGKVLITP